MEVKAKSKYVRVSSNKMRSLAQAIQGRPVAEAMQIAQFSPRKAGLLIGRTLKSAVANAENNAKMTVERLRVKEAVIEIGPTLKRSWPRARGMASPIKKHTSHIVITVTDDVASPSRQAAGKE